MPKPLETITPDKRVDRWRKLWASPVVLSDVDTEAAFEEFSEAVVPSHMHKRFLKIFGVPKAVFGNRFFKDEAVYRNWDTRLSSLLPSQVEHADVTVIYGSPDAIEGHQLRGQVRRTLRDIVIDDWFAAAAIVRGGGMNLYVFVEYKMKGCIVLSIKDENYTEPVEDLDAEPELID